MSRFCIQPWKKSENINCNKPKRKKYIKKVLFFIYFFLFDLIDNKNWPLNNKCLRSTYGRETIHFTLYCLLQTVMAILWTLLPSNHALPLFCSIDERFYLIVTHAKGLLHTCLYTRLLCIKHRFRYLIATLLVSDSLCDSPIYRL